MRLSLTAAAVVFAYVAGITAFGTWLGRRRRSVEHYFLAGRSLGLSLGEYSHLVHIGALELDDALRLVDERGRCYDEAPPGTMATVLTVDRETVAASAATRTDP